MEFKPGSRWKSAVDSTEVVVVRAPNGAITLECGGAAMIPMGTTALAGLSLSPAHSGGTAVGKRYVDAQSGIELLASKAGAGSLSVSGRAVTIKDAKPLPSSD
jgi:hypothetical protein